MPTDPDAPHAVDVSSHRMRAKFKFGALRRGDGGRARTSPSAWCPSFAWAVAGVVLAAGTALTRFSTPIVTASTRRNWSHSVFAPMAPPDVRGWWYGSLRCAGDGASPSRAPDRCGPGEPVFASLWSLISPASPPTAPRSQARWRSARNRDARGASASQTVHAEGHHPVQADKVESESPEPSRPRAPWAMPPKKTTKGETERQRKQERLPPFDEHERGGSESRRKFPPRADGSGGRITRRAASMAAEFAAVALHRPSRRENIGGVLRAADVCGVELVLLGGGALPPEPLGHPKAAGTRSAPTGSRTVSTRKLFAEYLRFYAADNTANSAAGNAPPGCLQPSAGSIPSMNPSLAMKGSNEAGGGGSSVAAAPADVVLPAVHAPGANYEIGIPPEGRRRAPVRPRRPSPRRPDRASGRTMAARRRQGRPQSRCAHTSARGMRACSSTARLRSARAPRAARAPRTRPREERPATSPGPAGRTLRAASRGRGPRRTRQKNNRPERSRFGSHPAQRGRHGALRERRDREP